MSNQKQRVEVTLLSKDEVEGKLKILEKVGRSCNIGYWTSTSSSSLYADDCLAREFFVAPSGELHEWHYVFSSCGVRPVLKSNNLDELIKGLNSKTENGVQIVEYGEFPDLFEKIKITNTSYLRKTEKEYIIPSSKGWLANFDIYKYPEYKYNDKKYIKIDDSFYKVKPIEFYVDRENHMLISKKVLFSSPLNIDKRTYNNRTYNGNFRTSQLYEFLNNEFLRELKPSEEQTENLFDEEIENLFDDLQKSLIEKIDELLKRNAKLQAISKAMASELKELKDEVKGKKYVRK